MATTITFHLFSGRPNPVKQISERTEKELFARLERMHRRPARRVSPASSQFGTFTVTRRIARRRLQFTVGYGLVENALFPNVAWSDSEGVFEFLVGVLRSPLLSNRLLTALSKVARPDFRDRTVSTFKCGVNKTVDAQEFDAMWGRWYSTSFGAWIDHWPCNNCYDYANNKLTDTYSQPGIGGGKEFRSHTCKDLAGAAESDGLRRVTRLSRLGLNQGWYVVLLLGRILDEPDFHWLKQDASGCWSHKMGGGQPSEHDASVKKIKIPESANFSYYGGLMVYDTICGYFVTHANVTIKGRGKLSCEQPIY